MIIKSLIEDTSCSENITAEHGLCLYIETDTHRLLFDTGKSDLFLENAEKMNVDISSVDTCIISHGHYDHGGGLKTFLRSNDRAQIYMNANAFDQHLSATGNYIGIDQELKGNSRFINTGDHFDIDEELHIFTGNEKGFVFRPRTDGLKVERFGRVIYDDFIDEQYLVISEPGKPKVLITGCSHKGIVNIMNWAKNYQVSYVIGGFHFMKVPVDAPDGKAYMCEAAEELSMFGVTFYTCHCTGKPQFDYMKRLLPGRLKYLSAGETLVLPPA